MDIVKENEVVSDGFNLEVNELIEGMTNRITQLTMDNIVKDMIIRKLEEQLKVDGA